MMRRAAVLGLVGASAVGLWLSWDRLAERWLLPAVGARLAQHVERQSGWLLSYRGIGGNVVSEVHLYGVRLTPARGSAWPARPEAEVAVVAEAVHATYRPIDLLHRRVRTVAVERPQLHAGGLRADLEVMQTGDLLVVGWPAQRIALDRLSAWLPLPEGARLDGHVRVGGEWLLKDYQPHLMRLRIQGEGLALRAGSTLEAVADADLEVHGPLPEPSLSAARGLGVSGRITVTKGRWRTRGESLTGLLALHDSAFLGLARGLPVALHVRVDGRNVWIHTDALHAKLRASLLLSKPLVGAPQLAGPIEAVDGLYLAGRRRFALRRGVVRFADASGEPARLEAELGTRVRRHHIVAAVAGTLDDSALRLSAQPPLAPPEILALLEDHPHGRANGLTLGLLPDFAELLSEPTGQQGSQSVANETDPIRFRWYH
jgi:hypothetical protein